MTVEVLLLVVEGIILNVAGVVIIVVAGGSGVVDFGKLQFSGTKTKGKLQCDPTITLHYITSNKVLRFVRNVTIFYYKNNSTILNTAISSSSSLLFQTVCRFPLT